jgi:hypothetical protein
MEQSQINTTASPLTSWPGAFGAFNPSREVVRVNLKTLVLLALCFIGVSIVAGMILGHIFILNEIASLAVSAGLTVSLTSVFLSGIHGNHVTFDKALNTIGPLWWKMVLLNLLVGLTVVGGLLLLIVPGFIFATRLVLAPYFLVDKKMGVLEAYKASWHATQGNGGKIWAIFGFTILMILPVFTVIGIIATVYLTWMYSAVFALFYTYINSSAKSEKSATS